MRRHQSRQWEHVLVRPRVSVHLGWIHLKYTRIAKKARTCLFASRLGYAYGVSDKSMARSSVQSYFTGSFGLFSSRASRVQSKFYPPPSRTTGLAERFCLCVLLSLAFGAAFLGLTRIMFVEFVMLVTGNFFNRYGNLIHADIV